MKKYVFVSILCFGLIGLFVACSNEETLESPNMATTDMAVVEDASSESEIGREQELEGVNADENRTSNEVLLEDGRQIIYHAHLNVEVKNLDESILDIQERTETLEGYVVESTVQGKNTELDRTGNLTIRIPQDSLQKFIQHVEDKSSRVIESSITGQDVTEEYVDLQTRLQSKQMVEERLLNFMEEAERTEDLLAISSELDQVQEEIETIKGRIHYLDNKIDLATVTIYLQENDVTLAGGNDAKIWDKTKEQFVKSIQFLMTTLTNLFIFLVGNVPVFIFIGLVGLVIYLFVRKMRNKNKER